MTNFSTKNNSSSRLFSEIGSAKLREISQSQAVYTDFLKFQGRIFKHPAGVAIEFFAQRPDAKFIATEQQWAAAGYKIKDGGTAIHFTDKNGSRLDLFDFSQVDGTIAPRLWTINNENAGQFKSALEVAQDAPIVRSTIEKTAKKSSVLECMETLGIPPNEFDAFQRTYWGAVQTIIAGRYEIGGNQFDAKPDMTAFTALDDNRKMHFLSHVSMAARASLLQIEKIANEILNGRSVQYETNVSAVGKSHGGTAEQRTGGRVSGNPTGGVAERTDNVANDSARRAESLGNSSGRTDENLPGIQADGRGGDSDVVQVQPNVGVLQHESDGPGFRTSDNRVANRQLRDEVDGLHGEKPPALGGGTSAQTAVSDSSEVGGRGSVGVQGTARQPVRKSESAPDDVRGNSAVGADESVLHGRRGDEGESADSPNSGLTAKQKLNNLFETPVKAETASKAGVSSRSRRKTNPNQLSLWEVNEPENEITTAPSKTNYSAVSQDVIDNILSHGGNDKDSLLRIIAQFQKGKTAILNAEFLKDEFTGRSTGDIRGRGHIVDNQKYAVWFTEDGISIGLGESANSHQTVVSWEQAAKRISELLTQGAFATQENLDKAWDYEIKHRADQMWFLGQDCEDGEGEFIQELRTSGFPKDTAKIAELLKDPQFLQETIDNLQEFCERYDENPDILRFHFHKPHGLLEKLQDLQRKPILFEANPAFTLESKLFITDDEKNRLIIDGKHNNIGKEKIAEYFRENAAQMSDLEAFVRKNYSHNAGSSQSGRSINSSSKGLRLERQFQYKFGHDTHNYDKYDEVLLSWRDIANRINRAIKAGTYLPVKTTEPAPELAETSVVKPEIHIADNGSPAPVFFLDWNQTQHDIDLNLYKDGDIIGYDKNGVESKVGKSGKLTYVTTTGAFWGSNNVPDNILGQIESHRNGAVSDDQIRENYLQYFKDYAALKAVENAQKSIETADNSPYSLYLQAKEQSPDSLMFIQVGDFYEAFGDDAKVISEMCDLTLASRLVGNQRIPMCGIPDFSLDKNIKTLIENGHKVAVTEADGKINDLDTIYRREGEKQAWEIGEELPEETPEKQYNLGYGNLGNGITVYNRAEEENGDYKTVAHIGTEHEGGVKFYEDLPPEVRERIIKVVKTAKPPTEQELDKHLENIVERTPAPEVNPELADVFGEETALKLQEAFENSKMDGYESNIIKQRQIKKALHEILGNVADTENAFTVLTGIQPAEPAPKETADSTETAEITDSLPEIIYADNPHDKFQDNMAAIREMKRLEDCARTGRDPFDSKYNDRENSESRLSRYSGWGGLSQVFDENNNEWARQRSILKETLTPEEYEAARETTLNAHYTPQIIIDAMYEAVKNMDLPRNARILEPSCGTGNFIRRLPSAFNEAEITGVEIDGITAKIAKYLNPDARIIESGFERSGLDDNDFDLAVGNIPFGNWKLNDPDYTQDWLIHDAFFRKALDKVAPGGVVAFVTSSGTLDKVNPRVREYLARQAELVGAVRLPNNAFKDAGTKVTADIIFLQKRKTSLLPYEEMPDWCYVAPNSDSLKINSYFVNNPQMILGKMVQTTHFDMLTCRPFENADLKQQLTQAIGNLNAKITVEKREKATKERAGLVDADGDIRNFCFGELSGKYYYRTGDKMQEINPTEHLKALCELRTKMRELLDKQKTEIPDDMLFAIRTDLNKIYDNYRTKYGLINSPATKKIFGIDADCPLILGLETQDPKTEKWEKADIFFKRTVNPVAEITGAETVEEALQISLDRRGRPDMEYMAELLEREQDGVCRELLEKGLCFRDPDKILPDTLYSGIVERSEYLSGNVRRKLVAAEATMLTQADPALGLDYKRNVEALQGVIPEDIKAENIAVRMGVPWIDAADYTKFLQHLAGRGSYASNGTVTYSAATGEFEVTGAKKRDKSGLNVNESTKYGTKDYSLYALAEKSLNQRQIVVKVERPHPTEPDKTVMKTDSKATKMALEKARLIKEEFKKWIFDDPQRRAKYERRYNDIFNCLVGREYDGSKMTFPGMRSDFQMREHQKNAVARTTMGGNSLIAHVVGAGKSAVIFATIMRKKEIGMINKACVVVPKPLCEQIAKEWRHLYPEAKLLTVTNDDLSDENKRKIFTAKVATGAYDAVILSREQFEKIPLSREARIAFMRKELDQVEDLLRERKRERHGKGDPTTKQLELAKKRMKARLEKLTDPKSAAKAKDDLLEFEQLGFDYLAVDEFHSYKNGFVMTKMTNVAGVTTRESGRAADMQMKCDYFNEQLGLGHLLACTGTPVSNSMTELYVMTRYLRPDLLRAAGIERFDDWAAVFGNVTTQLEQTAYDTYKLKTRFSEFANLPELMSFYKEFADVKSAEKLELPRPDLKNGKNTIVNVPATPEQKAYVKELGQRAEAINSGAVPPHEDNFLKITGEARLIGLGNLAVKALYEKSGREIPPEFVDGEKNGKVDACVEKVFERWEQSAANKGVQLVFSDIAVNDDGGNFSAYKYIRGELIAKGIPTEQIIFAPKSDEKNREEIFKRINSGEYRVVIASTETLGTGCNIQKKLIALHHIDVPWKPSCLEQREGRILRQGNENPEVEILNYVTASTLDSYLYSTVTNKARFIAQILDNESPARICEDLDERVLTYAEIQAVAAGNPDIKLRIETSNELAELNMLQREWGNEKAKMRECLEVLPMRLAKAEAKLATIRQDLPGAKAVAEMEQLPFDNKRLHALVAQAVANFKKGDDTPLSVGTIGGFMVTVKAEEVTNGLTLDSYSTEIVPKFIVNGAGEYTCEAGRGETDNNIVRLKNVFASIIPKREPAAVSEVERYKSDIEQAKAQIDLPFEHAEKIEELTKLLDEVDARLSGITKQDDVIGDTEAVPSPEEDLTETREDSDEQEYDLDDDIDSPRKGRIA